jgi:Tol biopolymer transport system component
LEDAGRATATIVDISQRSIVRELPLINHARGTLPHFSSDGDALAFVEQQKQGFALVLQPIDGLEPRVLTALFKDPISDFGWSPSGNYLAIMLEHATSDVALIKDESTSSRK